MNHKYYFVNISNMYDVINASDRLSLYVPITKLMYTCHFPPTVNMGFKICKLYFLISMVWFDRSNKRAI